MPPPTTTTSHLLLMVLAPLQATVPAALLPRSRPRLARELLLPLRRSGLCRFYIALPGHPGAEPRPQVHAGRVEPAATDAARCSAGC